MKKFLLLLLFLVLTTLFGCSEDSPISDLTPKDDVDMINNSIKIHEDNYSSLIKLLNVMDTTSAKDSIVKVIEADTSVNWAESNSQGIVIQYNSGMRGGIILDFEDDPLGTDPPGFNLTNNNSLNKGSQSNYTIPFNKRTVLINPHYYEREA